MDYTLEDWPGYSVLALHGGLNEIPRLWQRVDSDIAAGRLKVTSEPKLVGTVRGIAPALAYLAGAVSPPGATCEGYDRIDIPRGRYAVAHMRGTFTDIPAKFATLASALTKARHTIEGFGIEIYYGDPDGPDARYDLCYRVKA